MSQKYCYYHVHGETAFNCIHVESEEIVSLVMHSELLILYFCNRKHLNVRERKIVEREISLLCLHNAGCRNPFSLVVESN